MKHFDSRTLATATGGTVERKGPAGPVGTDTRHLPPGAWFLALTGDRFDGHAFVDRARAQGCAGVVARQPCPSSWDRGWVRVGDTLRALQDLASDVRRGFSGPVVGITGSVGKTTTRALTALALEARYRVHQTAGNLNNHVGLPLTLLATPARAEALVLELGMSGFGEIRRLQEIARPTVRLVTNVAPAHLEGVGDIEGVARAKGELFEGAQPGDVLCVNADDPRVAALPRPRGTHTLLYGSSLDGSCLYSLYRSSQACDLQWLPPRIHRESLETRLGFVVAGQRLEARLPVPGLHLAENAAAALAIAMACGVAPSKAAARLASFRPVGMRMRVESLRPGIRVLNDAYNASPPGVRGALETLRAIPDVRRVALLGDMLELGPRAVEHHRQVLSSADARALDLLGVCGPLMSEAAADRGAAVRTADDAESLARQVQAPLARLARQGEVVVLIKGSRGMAMERILPVLSESLRPEGD